MAKEYFVKEEDIDVLKNNVDNKISSPNTAEVGQILSVKAIDGNGKPTEWEVVNKPGSGPGESSPYIYMTQAEYEALTEYEQDRMYWVTYPFTGCYLVWKNGVAIMGEGCTELPVYMYNATEGRYFCANRNIVINFNTNKGTFKQTLKTSSTAYIAYGNNLELVEMTDNVDSIKANCFENHDNLKGIKLSNNISEIPSYLCSNCQKLERVIIGSGTLTIGDHSFANCSSLTSITIPNSVTSIGGEAFNGCSSLTSITIPDSVTSIEVATFNGCSSLTSITIPNSVTSIGSSAFNGCSSLTSITIPDSVKSIANSTFTACANLTSITIPNSVTSIGYLAFDNCTNLANIYYKGTSSQWNAITKSNDWNYNMGSNVSGGTVIHYNS